MAAKLEDPIDGSSAPPPMLARPHRGSFGDPRPRSVAGLALPPAAMPSRSGLRPLKVEAIGSLTAAGGAPRRIDGRAIVDDSAGYHERHVHWRWCAGVGTADDGRAVAWNLTDGIHDAATASERTIWIDGRGHEPPPTTIAADLSGVGELRFAAESERRRHENLLLVRSRYRQPFGTFAGALPGGPRLASGWGVMEDQAVHW